MRAESRCSRVGGRAIHRARYYNPYLCRFISADPSGFGGGLNYYAYANGNPVSYLDPFGLNATATGDTSSSWFDRAIDAAGTAVENALNFLNDVNQKLYPPPAIEAQKPAWQQAIDKFGQTVMAMGGVPEAEMPEMLGLTANAQRTLAETQRGVLLGTIENGQINLFNASAGQIEGHAGLVNQGLASPNALGFSIDIGNGQVTTLRGLSSLNSETLNFNLPATTVNQLNILFQPQRIILNP